MKVYRINDPWRIYHYQIQFFSFRKHRGILLVMQGEMIDVRSSSAPLLLFGVDSIFSAEVIETAQRLNRKIAHALELGAPEWDYFGIKVASVVLPLPATVLKLSVSVPWVTPGFRQEKVLLAKEMGFVEFATLIDPTAVIAQSTKVQVGTFINAGATLGAYVSLDDHVLVNRNASIGHHSGCGSFVSIGPGATVAARCSIGKGTMIGAGAVISS